MIVIVTLCICGDSGSDDGMIVTVIFPALSVCCFLLYISVLSIMYFCITYYIFLYYNLVMFKVVAVIITLGSFSD